MYYVYELIDPTTNEPKYVGSTKDPQRRYAAHLKPLSDKSAWIHELLKRNEQPLLRLIEKVRDKNRANSRERYWIKCYRRAEIKLFNRHANNGDVDISTMEKVRLKSSTKKRSIKKNVFLSKLIMADMTRKEFVGRMNGFGFGWTMSTLSSVTRNLRFVKKEEVDAMCVVLDCQPSELFLMPPQREQRRKQK